VTGLGVPAGTAAFLFDLDGVLTSTSTVHAAAWRTMFDEYLRSRPEPFVPFDPDEDYRRYLDGRLRADGTRAFLASRGITLPEGSPDDPPDARTVHGLGNRKNALVARLIEQGGVRSYPGARRYLEAVRDAGLPRAVVSASANCRPVLAVTGLAELVPVVVDGEVAAERGLAGKPAPDTFLAAAAELGVDPAHAVVFEDALSGVAAGRAGGFGFVVGIDRAHQADALREHGADLVVDDLGALL
jgi:beta-phosphoglucomutase family hydrolase